jgi:hypothetical protein
VFWDCMIFDIHNTGMEEVIKIFKKAKILEKSQIRKLIDFVNRNKGSTIFQTFY